MSDIITVPPRRPVGAPRGRRAHGLAREQQILDAAAELFAETGLDAPTRDLAARLGITQPLLYRYFESKERLIERVLDDAFPGDWKPEWEALLGDRTIPLRERLIAFLLEFSEEVLTHRRLRLLMYSGLKGIGPGPRVFQSFRARILDRVMAESRHAFSLPAQDAMPARGMEFAWNLYDSILALALRQHVFGHPCVKDLRAIIADKVDAFLLGAPVGMALPAESLAPDTAGWAAESLATGGMVWAGPPKLEQAASIGAGELGSLVWEKLEGTSPRAHD